MSKLLDTRDYFSERKVEVNPYTLREDGGICLIPEQKDQLSYLYKMYEKSFQPGSKSTPHAEQRINTIDSIPVFVQTYRITSDRKLTLQKEVETNIA